MEQDILVLDVDGTVNTIEDAWGDSLTTTVDEFPLRLSRKMGEAISDLDTRIFWLSTWCFGFGATKNLQTIADLMGLKFTKTLPTFNGDAKEQAMARFLQEEGPLVVWVDDDPGIDVKSIPDPYGRLIFVLVDHKTGITPQVIEEIRIKKQERKASK